MKFFTKLILLIVAIGSFAYGVSTVKYKVDPAKCVGCTTCVSGCPTQAITMVDSKAVIDPAKCIGCGACAAVCPVQAIAPDSTSAVDSTITPKKI